MHSKQKGSIGETAIAKDLLERDFNVFFDYGDLSKVDLIIEKNNEIFRLQIKSITPKKGVVQIDRRKSGPNYRFVYQKEQIDIFAIYVIGKDLIVYISSTELCKRKTGLNLRLDPPKNNQKKVNMLKDFTLDRCLRDCTRCIPTGDAVDNDTVQTTTEEILASES